jgi:hypothetical protein
VTNFEKWHTYMKDCTSPTSFIDWGLYALIAATLQRKVWLNAPTFDDPIALFPNLYVILTAEPGIGKGLVIKPVKKMLMHWKRDGKAQAAFDNSDQNDEKKVKKHLSQDTLIPLGPDAVTVEALIKSMAHSVRTHWYIPTPGSPKIPYFHSSLGVCLEEISTMFKKHTEDLVNFLLLTYDCGDYKYETISRGTDSIHNCCFNLLGGTTPAFIKKVFSKDLFDEGFSSRTVFVMEETNRDWRARGIAKNEDQNQARVELLEHIKKLTTLFGEVKWGPDAAEYLDDWWKKTNIDPKLRPNQNPKLKGYYARKNITVQKLAMCLHFMEHTSMEISLTELQHAIAILDKVEYKMHLALSSEGKNVLSEVTEKIYLLIKNRGPKSLNDLWVEFYEELPGNSKQSLMDIMEYLCSTGKLAIENQKYKVKQ